MARHCPFCGKDFRGQHKNKEHVISDWLVREADLGKRNTTVHFDGRTIEIAMNRIVADACKECNSSYSGLEELAKAALTKLKEGSDLEENDGQVLLDWLDKVRIGFWLWLIGASRGQLKIVPKFNIDGRIGQKDRFAFIARYSGRQNMKGLAFWGVGQQFPYMPSVIGFLINNIALVSVSNDLIVARHMRHVHLDYKINDKLLMEYNIEIIDDGKPNSDKSLRILGSPTIIGQCISTRDILQDELGLQEVRQSARHATLIETPVYRFDQWLNPMEGKIGIVGEIATNIDTHITLMEMNVSRSIEYVIRDFLLADFSYIPNFARRQSIINMYNRFLSEERDHLANLRARYQRLTGLSLAI